MKRLPLFAARRRSALAVASAAGAIALAASMASATSAAAAEAASAAQISGSATYHARVGHVTRLGESTHGLKGLAVHAAVKPRGALALPTTPSGVRMIPFRSPDGPYPAGKDLGGLSGPNVASSALAGRTVAAKTTGVSLVHSFNGISDLSQAGVNPGVGEVTPPDQGLCVGYDHSLPGSPKVVWEIVNDAFTEYLPNGTVLAGPYSTADLLINAYSDPRCLYDPKTQSFYFTEIGLVASGPDAGQSADDVTVLNGHGAAFYQVDTSEGGNCLGDQPKTGFDKNALIISTDQYCATYEGALVVVISKSQLVALDKTVKYASLGAVSLGGIPVVGLDPAINTGTGTGYLVNSFPYTAAGNNNAVSHFLGLWKLKDDASVTTGKGTPVLTGKVISSEQYVFPVPAVSTGDGTVSTVDGLPITSEAYLNPDDSRLSAPVNVTTDDGVVSLWTALDSAVNVGSSPEAVDGAAWFKINTSTQKVASQGYVAQKGANLLYPALVAPPSGPTAMVFTITSASVDPSAAYTTLGSRKVTVVGAGTGPHVSFSDALFNSARWGDYSWASIDPGTNGIWLATEYTPPAPDQDPIDNWGTFIFKLSR